MTTAALALIGDWNATPQDRGRYSPQWIAARTGLAIHSSGPGRHGDIDYVLADCEVVQPQRQPPPVVGGGGSYELGDHDVVTFRLRPPATGRTLLLASWNVEYGRRPDVVRRQLVQLLDARRPDVVALQEAADYHHELRAAASQLGYRMLAYGGHGRMHQVILARGKHRATGPRLVQLSPLGWPLADGTGAHAPLYAVSWAVDWLRVVDVHMPPSVNWRRGVPYGPPRKLAAYAAGAGKLTRWAKRLRSRT